MFMCQSLYMRSGDRHASNDFFIKLQSICQRVRHVHVYQMYMSFCNLHVQNGAAFIVDEVQTGCGATGHMW